MTACERAAFYFSLLLILGETPHCVTAGKVLVWPGEFSHWFHFRVIIEGLIERGHNVTVVTYSATPSVNTTPSLGYNVEIIQVPHTKQDVTDRMDGFIKYWTYDMANDNIIQASLKIKELINFMSQQNDVFCRNLFARKDLMEKWNKEEFEVLLTDPMIFCWELLAQKLNLSFIISLRFSFGSAMERLCGQLPAPPSYVPGAAFGYTDEMGFPQRLNNFLFYRFQDFVFRLVTRRWDHLFTEMMGKQ
ncbi:UDP-glucuronosyltransferase 2A2-like [Pygocentrus nattereri]|uniref:UDP-glucuronosyltransferase 2A2-like n=1 Tax=Pygocentrus nattereri TaxID=42514 RepID=UPI00189140C4|nr:UDP-glucuronosyltransferase 2A2-like [Pygocentrus nattereri]